jgi:CDP-glucose 4,6-dehydratase
MKENSSLQNFYKNKKIFLTGHTGFKGSWLSLWLSMMGANVCGFALKAEEESLFNVASVKNNLSESIIGDIQNAEEIDAAVRKFEPEIIIHMAAQSLVRESYYNPIKTYKTNVMGTLNVFEAARKCENVKTILNITTDKCYENKESLNSYKEEDPLGGYDPYSSSKACAEILTSSYYRSFFSKNNQSLGSARAGNVIGGGDFSVDRIVPDLFRSIRNKNNVEIRSPNAIRPWQHVLEPLYGYLLFVKKLSQTGQSTPKAYNFGPNSDSELTVEHLTKMFIQKIGSGSYAVNDNKELHEANLLKLDISKAKIDLSWSPKLSFEETISWTASWYKEYLKDEKHIKNFTESQIATFNKLL